MANPDGKGGFKPGQSGNPGGRRQRHALDLAREARKLAPLCLTALKEVVKNGEARARLAAASIILDRGYGRAAQQIDLFTFGQKLTPEQAETLEARIFVGPEGEEQLELLQ
jgi:hypothetical protein